jgi:hypothetical protein
VELFADQVLAEASGLFLHPGVYDAGVDAHHGDPVRFSFEGEDAGELVQGGFGGGVGGHPCDGVSGGGAGDVDYAAPVRRGHAGQRLPGAQEGPCYVDVEGAAPAFGSCGRDRERDAGCARVVYEDGDVAELLAHRLEAGRDRDLVGHVHHHGDGGAAAGGDLSCHRDDLLLRAGGEGHGGAFSGEETGRRRPDAAARAGHERDASCVRPTFRHIR